MTNHFNPIKSTLRSYSTKFLISAALIIPGISLAAGNATIEIDEGIASIHWLDVNNARFNMPDTKDYLLAKDNKVYVVSQDDGDLMVMEMGGIAQLAMAFADTGGMDKIIPDNITKVKATGKKEKIAGIKGEVYKLTIKQKDGTIEEMEVVLTDNKVSNELTNLYINLIQNLIGIKNFNESFEQLPKNKRGILRIEDEFIVTSLSSKAPKKEDLELPAEPFSMQNLMQDLQKMMQNLGED